MGTPGTAPETQGLIPCDVPMRSQFVPVTWEWSYSVFTRLFPLFPLFPRKLQRFRNS